MEEGTMDEGTEHETARDGGDMDRVNEEAREREGRREGGAGNSNMLNFLREPREGGTVSRPS